MRILKILLCEKPVTDASLQLIRNEINNNKKKIEDLDKRNKALAKKLKELEPAVKTQQRKEKATNRKYMKKTYG